MEGPRNKSIIAKNYGPLQIPLEHIQGTALPLPHSVRDSIIVRFKALSREAQILSFLIALSRRELSEKCPEGCHSTASKPSQHID